MPNVLEMTLRLELLVGKRKRRILNGVKEDVIRCERKRCRGLERMGAADWPWQNLKGTLERSSSMQY